MAIQEYHHRTHGLDIDLERISATSSGMTSIMIALQCLVEPGDNVVVVAPVWPNIVIAIEAMGAEVRFVRLDADEKSWSLDLTAVDAACDERTRAIFVASPANPTGWTMTSNEQRELLDLARRHNIWVISDEVYNRLVYDNSFATPSFLEVAQDDDALFVVQSFSKTWAMTGWRLGWLVHPAALAHQVGNLSAINSTGSATFVQHAGVAAIRDGEPFVADLLARCRHGRNMVADALGQIARVSTPPVPASFYTFFKIDGVEEDLEYAQQLVARAGVGLAPGSASAPATTATSGSASHRTRSAWPRPWTGSSPPSERHGERRRVVASRPTRRRAGRSARPASRRGPPTRGSAGVGTPASASAPSARGSTSAASGWTRRTATGSSG